MQNVTITAVDPLGPPIICIDRHWELMTATAVRLQMSFARYWSEAKLAYAAQPVMNPAESMEYMFMKNRSVIIEYG